MHLCIILKVNYICVCVTINQNQPWAYARHKYFLLTNILWYDMLVSNVASKYYKVLEYVKHKNVFKTSHKYLVHRNTNYTNM